MKIEWNNPFSKLQLTCNIRQFRKFQFKMLKNNQDVAFFVGPFEFELYKSLKQTDIGKISFILFPLVFSTWPIESKVFYYEILCCIVFFVT